jgi:NitT/TauT family transport system permease protein
MSRINNPGQKKKKKFRNLFRVVSDNYQSVLVVFVFFALWELCVYIFNIPEKKLPAPSNILTHLFVKQSHSDYRWSMNIRITLYEFIWGFSITSFLGIILAIIIVWSKHIKNILMPLFIFINSLPIIAVAPLILLWAGYGLKTNILIAFLVGFFPVVINTMTGLDAIEEELLDLVCYLNASKFQIFIKIRLPNSLPYIFSGLKISATMSIVGAIVGEFIASDRGLGYVIINFLAIMDIPPVFAALFVISLAGAGLYLLVSLLEHVFMPWAFIKEKV